MSFPSDGGTLKFGLSEAWQGIRRAASQIKQSATTLRDSSAAGSVASRAILNFVNLLRDKRVEMAAFAAVPGLAAYAQEQVDDPTLDIAAEYTAMVAAVDATITWVVDNFPKDANGWLLARTLTAQGQLQDRMFTTVALANLRTELDALIATID